MTQQSRNTRYGYTHQGKKVPLNESVEVEGGFISYVLNAHGRAVQVYIPVGEDE